MRWFPGGFYGVERAFCLVACAGLQTATLGLADTPSVKSGEPTTFNRHVAPILFKQCAPCHRPGQTAPFSLLTFADARKRADQIAEVTRNRLMPPWLAESGHVTYANERHLADAEIERFQAWIRDGLLEGEAADLPPIPVFSGEWELGQPDLVVKLGEAFELPAGGKDVYRNFVVPIPGELRRFVRGVEFAPGTNRVIHHAFINLDASRVSRRMASGNPSGFDGMVLPETAHMPEGQLLSWQPGRHAAWAAGGLSWTLEPGQDLVLQLHLRPSGKPELVRPSVGFYFTNQAASNLPFRLNLTQLQIQIPAGADAHHVGNEFQLPVDVTMLGLLPHLHYLGKSVTATATFPNGEEHTLLRIPRWNFDWQSDYALAKPVLLPAGTVLKMDFVYDNSASNPANPNHPPKPVVYGSQTSDEMAELWMQVQAGSLADRNRLAGALNAKLLQDSLDYNSLVVRQDPRNAEAHTRIAKALVVRGNDLQAMEHLKEALRAKPDHDKAYYEIGAILLRQNRLEPAEKSFRAVLRFNPNDYQAYGSLGVVYLRQRRWEDAEKALLSALEIHPGDDIAKKNLEVVQRTKLAPP